MAALLGALTQAAEEHNMEMESMIIDQIEKQAADQGKFFTYTAHLGQPAMHSELADGKWSTRPLLRY